MYFEFDVEDLVYFSNGWWRKEKQKRPWIVIGFTPSDSKISVDLEFWLIN
jgi:hypothetical protein